MLQNIGIKLWCKTSLVAYSTDNRSNSVFQSEGEPQVKNPIKLPAEMAVKMVNVRRFGGTHLYRLPANGTCHCDCLFSNRIVKKLEHGWKALVHDGVSYIVCSVY